MLDLSIFIITSITNRSMYVNQEMLLNGWTQGYYSHEFMNIDNQGRSYVNTRKIARAYNNTDLEYYSYLPGDSDPTIDRFDNVKVINIKTLHGKITVINDAEIYYDWYDAIRRVMRHRVFILEILDDSEIFHLMHSSNLQNQKIMGFAFHRHPSDGIIDVSYYDDQGLERQHYRFRRNYIIRKEFEHGKKITRRKIKIHVDLYDVLERQCFIQRLVQ